MQSSAKPAATLSLASLAAVLLVALEGGLAAIGRTTAGPALLLAACGLALVPFLPLELRRPAIVVPLVPVLAVMVSAVGVVTVASLGIPLTATAATGRPSLRGSTPAPSSPSPASSSSR